MAVYVPEQQRDLEKDLQYVAEGDVVTTPANFGSVATNPNFSFHGKNQRFVYRDGNDALPIQTIDDENRTSFKKIKNMGTLSLEYDLTDFAYNGDLSWFFNLNKTNFNSRNYYFSRNPGTEYYRKLYGCVPSRCTLSIPENNAPVHVSAEILVTNPQPEDTSAISLGTGALASAISADVVLPSDGGLDSFDWNSVAYKTKGMEISVTMGYNTVDADDSLVTQLMIPSRREITGSVNVFKKQGADAPHADIVARNVRAMRRVLKPFDSPTSGTRIDLATVDVPEDETNNADIRSEATIKNYSFTAGTVTLTELTS